jgi:hypothetical protein
MRTREGTIQIHPQGRVQKCKKSIAAPQHLRPSLAALSFFQAPAGHLLEMSKQPCACVPPLEQIRGPPILLASACARTIPVSSAMSDWILAIESSDHLLPTSFFFLNLPTFFLLKLLSFVSKPDLKTLSSFYEDLGSGDYFDHGTLKQSV